MEQLLKKYSEKLAQQDLAEKDNILFGALDAELFWNTDSKDKSVLNEVFKRLNINSLLFAKPKEPYLSIINYLTKKNPQTIYPLDCETRTFLHDLPVINEFSSDGIINTLKQKKSVIIKDKGIVTFGTIGPEQAFVTYSSVCFACYVKFHADLMTHKKTNTLEKEEIELFKFIHSFRQDLPKDIPTLLTGPFTESNSVTNALVEAGKLVVDYGLVDSYFGNISYTHDNIIHISQTGSSLDELTYCIDPCPMDNTTCAGITASSELSAHKRIIESTNIKAILHGHPKFSVIVSMDCQLECNENGICHNKCPHPRDFMGIPIVPGEVGTGPYGLCNTLPKAILHGPGEAIVYGHGVFTTSKTDFNQAFKNLLEIERMAQAQVIL